MADLYEMTMADAEGKVATVRFYASNDTNAKGQADVIGQKSDAKWKRLRKIAAVAVQNAVDTDPLYAANFAGAAAANSTVQKRGKGIFSTALPRNFIPVEIPAVKSAYLSPGSRTTASSPLQSGNLAKLRSENGTPATAFREARYLERIRR